MNKHISAHPSGGNEILNLAGLPLFAWVPPSRPLPSLLDLRAERIASLTGRPFNVVRLHLVAAGLGGSLR